MAKVLIVEDDPHTSGVMARLLATKGHRTRIESNGAAALLAAHEDMPDVILMDLMMPILEGQETIHALRHDPRTAHIPVIVLAAHIEDRTLADAIVTGANAYLVKPPDPQGLITLVERLGTLQPKDVAGS